jgi:hypothetical protein
VIERFEKIGDKPWIKKNENEKKNCDINRIYTD